LRSRLRLQRGYRQCEASRRLRSHPPLHVLVVEYDIVVGEIDKYLTAVKELGAASVKEAGFRQQYITISQNDPNHVLLFEAWDNAAAHAAHVATDRFKNTRQQLET
jgi:quinol monooxygenase YgiN